MQLDNIEQVEKTANRVNFSIFELPKDVEFKQFFPKSYHLEPEGKTNEIKIDQIREVTRITSSSQNNALFIVVEQADRIKTEAANAFLKSLEEPNQLIHYVFLTHNASAILPTIQSRANKYYLKSTQKIADPPSADVNIFSLAKEYVSASPQALPDLADKIIKTNKDDARKTALDVVSCSIDLMYKSYLLKGNPGFLTKLEQLLKTKAALEQNGHIKLQLIANML